MGQSTRRRSAGKPHPDFPLFPHKHGGQWCKKVRGKTRYFGPVKGDERGEAALALWLEQKDELLAGREPRAKDGSATVKYLCDAFLTFKEGLRDAGELAPRTYDYYEHVAIVVADVFGRSREVADLRPSDFEQLRGYMAKRWGAVRLGNMIQVVRSIFRYGAESDVLPTLPKFGPGFKKPAAKVLRKLREEKGPRMFDAESLRAIVNKATVNGKAMILLGVNGGLSNTDIALLPIRAIDLKTGWLTFARTKTGIPRRIPLWKETREALEAVLAARPAHKDPADASLVFIARRGESYLAKSTGSRVHQEFTRAAKLAKVEGRTYYDLRRTLQTIGEGAHDLAAVQSLMGHAAGAGDMSAVYRQRVDDERLIAVTEYVRGWLFPKQAEPLAAS